MKNNLQQVSALVTPRSRRAAAMKEDLTRRIAAMSAVHQHIYESNQFRRARRRRLSSPSVLTGLRDSAPPAVDARLALAAAAAVARTRRSRWG